MLFQRGNGTYTTVPHTLNNHYRMVEENPEEYVEGGYLPISIGTSFNNGRYLVVRKLGWGHFSTVWLVRNTITDRHAALKVVKSAPTFSEIARDEIILLNHVASVNASHPGHSHIISFLDSFTHRSPTSSDPKLKHQCMVFELLGPSLHHILHVHRAELKSRLASSDGTCPSNPTSASLGLPVKTLKLIASQTLLGLQYLHEECHLIHTDIKPENILIGLASVEDIILGQLNHGSRKKEVVAKLGSGTAKDSGIAGKDVQSFNSHSPSKLESSASSPSPPSLALDNGNGNSSRSNTDLSSPSKISLGDSTASLESDQTNQKKNGHLNQEQNGQMNQEEISRIVSPIPTPGQPEPSPRIPSPEEITTELKLPKKPVLVLPSTHEPPSVNPPSEKPPPGSHETVPGLCPSVIAAATTLATTSILEPDFTIKIADLGNATPIVKHFTNDIQTRHYRAPEIIIGREDWNEAVDIWSFGCVIFELLTGEYLFEPKGRPQVFSKDDDHMAQIIELLDDPSLEFKMGGRFSHKLFDSKGRLHRIKQLRFWPLLAVLTDKYMFPEEIAEGIVGFLECALAVDPKHRLTASQLLEHEWLKS